MTVKQVIVRVDISDTHTHIPMHLWLGLLSCLEHNAFLPQYYGFRHSKQNGTSN